MSNRIFNIRVQESRNPKGNSACTKVIILDTADIRDQIALQGIFVHSKKKA